VNEVQPTNSITPHLVPLPKGEETVWKLLLLIVKPVNYEGPINETP